MSVLSSLYPFFLRFSIDLFLFEKFLMNFPFCLVFLDLLLPFQWSLVESVNGWVGVYCTFFTLFHKVIIFLSYNWFFKNAENPLSQFSYLLAERKHQRQAWLFLSPWKFSRAKCFHEIMQRSVNVIMNNKFYSTPSFPQNWNCTRKFLNQLSMMTTWNLKAKVCVL